MKEYRNFGRTKCGHVTMKYSSNIQIVRKAKSEPRTKLAITYSLGRSSSGRIVPLAKVNNWGQKFPSLSDGTKYMMKMILRARVTRRRSQYLI